MIRIKKIIYITLLSLVFIFKIANAEISDSLFVTVGNKAITKSDVVNEIKIILIINNESYSDDKRENLHDIAIKSIIKRSVKQIAIGKNDLLRFDKKDLINELEKMATKINVDLETFKNICSSNELDFSLIEDQVKTELLWNSLIFHLYKSRISVNAEEINDQLKLIQSKKEIEEFLISEIVISSVEADQLKTKINEVKEKIKNEGFNNVAMNLSISTTAINGGDMGWLNENQMPEKIKTIVMTTPVGNITEPILLSRGILLLKIRNRRKIQKKSIEETKNELVNLEKTKILNMYSLSHYDSLRRSVAVNFLNE